MEAKSVGPLVAWVHGLISHHEIHDDELKARWFLRSFGADLFPNIRNAVLYLVDSGMRLLRGKTGAQWFADGYPCLGTCGGPLDEHELPPEERKNASAATLAAKQVGISEYPPIVAMLAHAVRVDRTPTAGNFDISAIVKAWHRNNVTISKVCSMYDRIADAWFNVLSGKTRNAEWKTRLTFNQLAAEWIVARLAPEEFDRTRTFATAFDAAEQIGFQSLRTLKPLLGYLIEDDIRMLNGSPAKDRLFEAAGLVDALNQDNAEPSAVRDIVFTTLDAKWAEQIRFMKAADELTAMKKAGTLYLSNARCPVIGVVSDNPDMNRAARYVAPNADVFIQRSATGHVVIWYNKKKFNMDAVMALLRSGDRDIRRMPRLPWDQLKDEGTLSAAPWWYYNPANGQIMNGSRTNRGTPMTKLSNNAIVQCITRGLSRNREEKPKKSAVDASNEILELLAEDQDLYDARQSESLPSGE